MVSRKLIAACLLLAASLLAHGQDPPAASPDQIRKALKQVEDMRNEAHYEEGLGLAQQSLHQAESLGNNELITESLFQISLMYYFLESYEEARAYMEIGLTHARLHQLEDLEADLLNAQGVLEWKLGNLFEATAKLEEALEIRKRQHQWVSMASIANNLGIIAYSLQQYKDAVNHYKQGIEWLGDRDNQRMRSSLYSNIAESMLPLGEYDEAETYLMKSLEIEENANEPHNLAYTYYNLGELRSGKGDSSGAIDLYHKALAIQMSIGNDWSSSLTRMKLAREYQRMGDTDKALQELKSGWERVKSLNALTLLRDYAEQFAALYKSTGQDGLSKYYQDLQNWFASRTEQHAPEPGSIAYTETDGNPSPDMVQPAGPDFSTIRIATLSLLGVLIIVLVIENMRLRKLMKDE